jgi:hypothetical protein
MQNHLGMLALFSNHITKDNKGRSHIRPRTNAQLHIIAVQAMICPLYLSYYILWIHALRGSIGFILPWMRSMLTLGDDDHIQESYLTIMSLHLYLSCILFWHRCLLFCATIFMIERSNEPMKKHANGSSHTLNLEWFHPIVIYPQTKHCIIDPAMFCKRKKEKRKSTSTSFPLCPLARESFSLLVP